MPTNGEPPYRVIFSGAIRDRLRELHHRAAGRGMTGRFLSALKAIVARLRSDPLVFGEPLKHLRAMRLEKRVAVEAPLSVQYAVDAERRLVYVTAFQPLAGLDL